MISATASLATYPHTVCAVADQTSSGHEIGDDQERHARGQTSRVAHSSSVPQMRGGGSGPKLTPASRPS